MASDVQNFHTVCLSLNVVRLFLQLFQLLVYVFVNFMGHFFSILVTSEMISSHCVPSLRICMSIENQGGYKEILISYSKKQQHYHFCDATSNMCMTYHISGMTFKTNGTFFVVVERTCYLGMDGDVNPNGNDMSINQT